MTLSEAERGGAGRYYQAIARAFFARRGAPFFLSPKDLVLIADWEKRSVPLDCVLEGIEKAFSGRRAGGKVMSLSFCGREIEAAFAADRERRVGRKKAKAPRTEKWRRARREIARFLEGGGGSPADVAGVFGRALEVLALEPVDEDALEKLDAEVDECLWRMAPAADLEKAAAGAGLAKGRRPEAENLFRTRLVKSLRDRLKVPYVSPYHY